MTSEPKWPKGPYRCQKDADTTFHRIYQQDDDGTPGQLLAEVGAHMLDVEEQESAANLFTAAPDFAAFAQWVVKHFPDRDWHDSDFRAEVANRADRLLAKARGGT